MASVDLSPTRVAEWWGGLSRESKAGVILVPVVAACILLAAVLNRTARPTPRAEPEVCAAGYMFWSA